VESAAFGHSGNGRLIELQAEPLSPAAFSSFGELIEPTGSPISINAGTSRKFADLAHIDVAREGGRPAVHLYLADARSGDEPITAMERHPLGSQLFMPIDRGRYLVVVAPAESDPTEKTLRAFVCDGVGINLKRGTWHCPLHVLDRACRFLVVDREGPGENLDIREMAIRVAGLDD